LSCRLLSRCFLVWLILRLWRWRWSVPPKRRLSFNGLHEVISQKIVLFIPTAVTNLGPTCVMTSFCTVKGRHAR
jgi:hypothetical protein